MSANAQTAVAPVHVSESVLDQRLDACSNLHKQAIDQQVQGNHSLWRAVAATYAWWRAMGGSDGDHHPDYLVRKCKGNDPKIAVKNVKRKFTPLINLAFGLTHKDQAATVSQYAAAMDWVHEKYRHDHADFSDDQATSEFEEAIFEDIRIKGGIVQCREDQLSKSPSGKFMRDNNIW